MLTGGGDVPGLNPCIKTLVAAAADRGYEVAGAAPRLGRPARLRPGRRRAPGPPRWPCRRQVVRTIDRTGGTFLHTGPDQPGQGQAPDVPGSWPARASIASEGPFDFTSHCLQVIERLGLDWLVAIGKDGTLSYAERLSREGVAALAVPKTMDNDVFGTDYCIGFSTAVTRSVQFIHQLRTSTGSHRAVAGGGAVRPGAAGPRCCPRTLAGVDRAIICEVPFDPERLAGYVLEDKASNPSRPCDGDHQRRCPNDPQAVEEQGEADAYGHRKLGGIGLVTGPSCSSGSRVRTSSTSAGLPDAVGRPGCAGSDGGGQLRQRWPST